MSLTNAVVLALAFGGLLVAPVSVSVPGAASELAVLGAGLLGLLAVSLALLRPAFRPLDELAETMHRHEPLAPGTRARVAGDPDVAALADAFNQLLERLEFERRDSACSALVLQEAEQRRIARELHDDVGAQTLTGVMLQVEALSASIAAHRGPSSTCCAKPSVTPRRRYVASRAGYALKRSKSSASAGHWLRSRRRSLSKRA